MSCAATLARVAYRGCRDANLQPGQVVVHMGASRGEETLRLAEKVGAGGRVYGVCADPGRLRLAIEQQRDARLRNVEFLEAGPGRVPLPDASAEVALVDMGVLGGHSRYQVLAEVHRLLAPGGRLVLCDVVNRDGNPLTECPAACRCEEPPTTEAAYRRLLREAGFARVQVFRRKIFACPQGHMVMEVTWQGSKERGNER